MRNAFAIAIGIICITGMMAQARAAESVKGLQPDKTFRDCANCPEMVVIPAGNFDMGSTNGDEDEKPVHRVTIDQSFAIGKTEVTQGQWKAIMGSNPSQFDCGDNCPVENVNWYDAKKYIQKLNAKTGKQYRLPSEAEWEYACRAGGKNEYCGSDNIDSVAWYGNEGKLGGNSDESTQPVGQKQANGYGLYDMSGNVWEWVEDSYRGDYNGAPVAVWKGDAKRRMSRGGSWINEPKNLRSAIRNASKPEERSYVSGFRLARTLP